MSSNFYDWLEYNTAMLLLEGQKVENLIFGSKEENKEQQDKNEKFHADLMDKIESELNEDNIRRLEFLRRITGKDEEDKKEDKFCYRDFFKDPTSGFIKSLYRKYVPKGKEETRMYFALEDFWDDMTKILSKEYKNENEKKEDIKKEIDSLTETLNELFLKDEKNEKSK